VLLLRVRQLLGFLVAALAAAGCLFDLHIILKLYFAAAQGCYDGLNLLPMPVCDDQELHLACLGELMEETSETGRLEGKEGLRDVRDPSSDGTSFFTHYNRPGRLHQECR
jgi:hypothetical protein